MADVVVRLEAGLTARGITLFARVDHAAGAAAAGMALRPTTVLIFGNPKGGTPLMQAGQTIGLDLPLRILAWEDATGQVRLTYPDLAALARRHGIDPAPQQTLAALTALLVAITNEAAAP
ncbi:MAG: DUF302 domain-containing protein [Acetobacteraceae bacterium]